MLTSILAVRAAGVQGVGVQGLVSVVFRGTPMTSTPCSNSATVRSMNGSRRDGGEVGSRRGTVAIPEFGCAKEGWIAAMLIGEGHDVAQPAGVLETRGDIRCVHANPGLVGRPRRRRRRGVSRGRSPCEHRRAGGRPR